jgi:hypothetical protein
MAGRDGVSASGAARQVGYLLSGIVGWLAAYLAIAATIVALSYMRSGAPPYCDPGMISRLTPPDYHGALNVQYIPFIALPGATLLVGLWWALRARTRGSLARRLLALVPIIVLGTVVAWYLLLGLVVVGVPLVGRLFFPC